MKPEVIRCCLRPPACRVSQTTELVRLIVHAHLWNTRTNLHKFRHISTPLCPQYVSFVTFIDCLIQGGDTLRKTATRFRYYRRRVRQTMHKNQNTTVLSVTHNYVRLLYDHNTCSEHSVSATIGLHRDREKR